MTFRLVTRDSHCRPNIIVGGATVPGGVNCWVLPGSVKTDSQQKAVMVAERIALLMERAKAAQHWHGR